ncbi:MAG: hypothetical protein ACOY46_16620 [Bacillota bacterium]
MEGKIKTALEKALERAAAMKEAPREEIEKMENMPRGRAIAASFLNNINFDLAGALAGIPEGLEKYVYEGIQEVLLMNIALFPDESADDSNRRAMEGIFFIKRDKKQITELIGEVDHLLKYYRQALEQTREKFRQDFEARGHMGRGRAARGREQEMMDFREEWSNVVKQMNARFEAGLADLKERIKGIK